MAICAVFACGVAIAAPAQNPRGGGAATTTTTSATSRADSGRVVRVNSASAENAGKTTTARNVATVSRTATARPSVTVARTATATPQKSTNVVTGRSGTIRQTAPTSANATSARSATVSRAAASNVVRAAHTPASTARAGTTKTVVGGSRASNARATAVFSDISAIGGGYAQCREAYATCMDQFCANANDTYRRCICSNRYNEFRDTENAIDQALNLLAQFQDNNLTAVNLSAEEVTAMYTATEGEEAIKRDTSAAANMLSEINDLLSGKSSSSSSSSSSGSSTSLGILTIDFSSDIGDIWGDGGGSSIFDSSTGVDLSTLTGQELYSAASRQCTEIIADSCENDAVLNMARSAYSIMITQDCNLYERNINTQKEGLEQTVRTAEKYLREARLEEYQSHNSADVNECISAVRTAIQTDSACGPNYERCLDYTGAYINQTTGEAIYSTRLFELAQMINLPGVSAGYNSSEDILTSNAPFNTFLDDKRIFAESALDTCRDIADTVWTEFKRQALIEIAQAQDEKIEEVKMSCVSTMAECYDTQTGALQDFDTTTSQYSGAVSAYAARSMCADKVMACATLYGNTDGCEFDETTGHDVAALPQIDRAFPGINQSMFHHRSFFGKKRKGAVHLHSEAFHGCGNTGTRHPFQIQGDLGSVLQENIPRMAYLAALAATCSRLRNAGQTFGLAEAGKRERRKDNQAFPVIPALSGRNKSNPLSKTPSRLFPEPLAAPICREQTWSCLPPLPKNKGDYIRQYPKSF